MEYRKHRPDIRLEIRRPQWESPSYQDRKVGEFVSAGSSADGIQNSHNRRFSGALMSYQYSESINDVSGSFSFTTTAIRDNYGDSWLEKIKKRDLAVFYERGKISFVGLITGKGLSSEMGDSSPNRILRFNGTSIGGLLQSFKLVLDLHILLSAATTAETESTQFMADLASKLNQGQRMDAVVENIYRSYLTVMEKIGQTNTGVFAFINDYVSLNISRKLTAPYPIAISLYETGEADLWSIVQSIITPPIHELFGQWSRNDEKYRVTMRQTPFNAEDWKNLPICYINSVQLKSYQLDQDDREVFTIYGAFFPGSAITREKALVVDNFSQYTKLDREKWCIYGYRPLFIDFRFFNRSEGESFNVGELMKDFSQTMYDWFRRNDEYYSGRIVFISDTREKEPNIGERVGFMGGEFYVEERQRSWQYGGSVTTSLRVSRGYEYSQGEHLNPMRKLSRKVDGSRA